MYFTMALSGRNGFFLSSILILTLFLGLSLGQLPYYLLFAYVVGILTFIGLYKSIHWRSILTLINSDTRIDWWRIGKICALWFIILISSEVIMYLQYPGNYIFQFEVKPFLVLAVVTLVLIPVQTSFEELLFRGYLIQQFALMTNSKISGLIISAVIFGLVHLANPEVAAFGAGKMLFYYICFGIFAGLCTLADDRLELALGIHAANNIYSSMFVTFEQSALQTPALFRLRKMDVVETVWFFVVAVILILIYYGYREQWYRKLSPFSDRIRF